MRTWFRFDWRLLEIANSIKNNWKRLRFYEAIINLWINDELPDEQAMSKELVKAMLILGKDLHISDARAEAWRSGNKKWNKNAEKKRKSVSSNSTQDSTQQTEISTTTQPEISEKQKARNTKKHDENVELIDKIKAKVESLWMVYRSWEKERINATNIRTSRAFLNTAQRFNMTSEQLAFAVIDASMKDKFRSWKINNCEMIYRHYARIINNDMKQASAIWVLPWA